VDINLIILGIHKELILFIDKNFLLGVVELFLDDIVLDSVDWR
jgi:hypothetical protein